MDTFHTCFDVTVTLPCLNLEIVQEKDDTTEIEFEFVDGEQRYILAFTPLTRLALSFLACQVGLSAARVLEQKDGTGHVMLPFVLQVRSSPVAERIC